jgi:hypothetical protein
MFRNLFRRGISVLALTLALSLLGAAPAAAAEASFLDHWKGVWCWAVSIWSTDDTSNGDRGPGLDPDGLTAGGDRGPEADPNGSTTEDDRGAGADPNG